MADGGGASSSLSRHAPIALVLALLLALVGTAAVAAPAAPKAPNAALAAKAKALQAKLDAQNAEVERLAERLNATDDRRHRLQASLGRLKARQKAAKAELDTAQAQLDEQARATYMGGPQWLLGELVGGANPPDAMRRIPMEKAALEARAAVVTEVRIRKGEVDSLNERVAADLAEADLVHRRQDDERRQVQRLVEQLQQTLDKVDTQLAGYLEAERDRSEASRRAAWAGYMSGVGTVQSWLQAGPVARAAVRWALAQLGDPYRWGATGPDDLRLLGADQLRPTGPPGSAIPRVSRAQWGAGPHVAVANLLPGDLVFYADNPGDPATIHHVGMYIGNGLMVHAPHTGDVVRVASIWRESYVGATRIVPGVVTPGLVGPPPTAPPPTSPTAPPPPPMTTTPPTTKPSPAPPTTRPPTTTTRPGAPTTTTAKPTTTTAPPTTTTAPPTTAPPTTAPPTTAAAEPTTTEAEPTTTGPPTTT